MSYFIRVSSKQFKNTTFDKALIYHIAYLKSSLGERALCVMVNYKIFEDILLFKTRKDAKSFIKLYKKAYKLETKKYNCKVEKVAKFKFFIKKSNLLYEKEDEERFYKEYMKILEYEDELRKAHKIEDIIV